MAEWRKIHTRFWNDPEWLDFTPEDKFFYLCLLTNPKTTACGVYEVHIKELSMWTGYNTETIEKLMEHFIRLGKIDYDEKTREVFIKNWFRYNSPRSPKLQALIRSEISCIKSAKFTAQVTALLRQYFDKVDTVSPQSDTVSPDSDTVSPQPDTVSPESDTVSKKSAGDLETIDIDKDFKDILSGKSLCPTPSQGENALKSEGEKKDLAFQDEVEQIIAELNRLTGRAFRTTGKQASYIRARLKEGFSVEDCLLVVHDRVQRWLHDQKMREYLRPSTLFNSEKFEAYLNEAKSGPVASKNIEILKQYLTGGMEREGAY